MISSFREYSSKFLTNDETNNINITLKIEHSIRVAKFALKISKGINIPASITEYAGLFHDVGRFEQYKQYKTFVDHLSTDHGDLGYQVLKKENFIQHFSEDEQVAILHAVRYHNKKELVESKSVFANTLLKITRDADKLDIFNIFGYHLKNKIRNPVLEQNLEEKPVIKEEILNAFLNEKTIHRTKIETSDEGRIGLLSWIFDFNYYSSKEIVLQNEALDLLLQSITVKEVIPIIENKIKTYRELFGGIK